jgi:hypothetical protein
MTAWLDALHNAWNELAATSPVARQYRTKLISKDVTLDVLAGMRAADDAPCLMLQTTPAPDALFELGGMRLSTVPDQAGTFLVLSLEDSARRDLFSTICADVVSAAAVATRSDALDQFLSRLDAWRQFLRDRRIGLSPADTTGLIGELLVLELALDDDPTCLSSWQSPSDGLHDFLNDGHALEVKTGLGPASAITISRLDQLDTSGLRRLDLFHVRLIEVPNGRSLRDIIDAITQMLPEAASRRAFENALLRRGLMPDDEIARTTPRIQQRAIDAYSISEDFPRLVRADVPVAIVEASYTLDVRAINSFAADSATILVAFVGKGVA